MNKTPQTTLRKDSRIFPQTYQNQHKEQKKAKLWSITKQKEKFPERSFFVAMTMNNSVETLEDMIKQELLLALESMKIHCFVLGKNPHSKKFKYIHFLDADMDKELYDKVDICIWPEASDMKNIMHSGTICISKKSKELKVYNPLRESGYGFMSPVKTCWEIFAEIIRAKEVYGFKYDWKHLCQNAMEASYKAK